MPAFPATPILDRNSPTPLYFQLKEDLRRQIESGRWRPGELIPPEPELESVYQVSRITVRHALRELQQAGVVDRQRGRGTFVTVPKLRHGPDHQLVDTLRAQGLAPGWRVLSAGPAEAPEEVAVRLGISPGSLVFRTQRLRLAGEQPIGHLVAYATVSGDAVSRESLLADRSLDYLQAIVHLERCRAERLIEAVPASATEAELLEVRTGAPMLRVRRLVTTEDGDAIEDFCGTYRGDCFQYLIVGSANPQLR
jgi:GntR family transcriptional regulator